MIICPHNDKVATITEWCRNIKCRVSIGIEEVSLRVDVNEDVDLSLDTAVNMSTVDAEHYTGGYIVEPSPSHDTVLDTHDKYMDDDVRVLQIPYFETRNDSGGFTVYIANQV